MFRGVINFLRKIALKNIKGDEILAQDIMTEYDTLLMSAGIVLRKEYIHRLIDLGITYIYVEDEYAKGIRKEDITEIMIKEQCQKEVQETLDKFTCSGSNELEAMKEVAQEIICDLLNDKDILFNVSGVRQKAESAYSHSVNVAALAVFIALKMKISKNKVREIAVGALLHDVGYTYVNTDIKEKSYKDFTDEEKRELRMHVVHGYTAVEKEGWLSGIAKEIIFHHHEHIDGSGYPMHIKGDRIKIGSKIVAVCDAFDRMVYGIFGEKMKVHEAMEYISANSGKMFDEKVTNFFNQVVAAYPTGTIVVTSTNEIGIVYRQNKGYPARPVIRMLKDSQGKEYEDWIEKDLLKELSLFIKDTVE